MFNWPNNLLQVDQSKYERLIHHLWENIEIYFAASDMQKGNIENLLSCYAYLAVWLSDEQDKLGQSLVLGINGAQGSGKSTMSALLSRILTDEFNKTVVSISIDDIYLKSSEREKLAHSIHPLLKTRGVPGTHDVSLGMSVLNALKSADPDDLTLIPQFDKSIDDRLPESEWAYYKGRPDIIILEGWCVGAQPQNLVELDTPINKLEAEEDAECKWRYYVNEQLAGKYQDLFRILDLLIMLQVPDFEKVYEWRSLQEQRLKVRLKSEGKSLDVMSDDELKHFISHYERLTRAMLKEMPDRVNVALLLDEDHKIAHARVGRFSHA